MNGTEKQNEILYTNVSIHINEDGKIWKIINLIGSRYLACQRERESWERVSLATPTMVYAMITSHLHQGAANYDLRAKSGWPPVV